jgi:hypothetical protein
MMIAKSFSGSIHKEVPVNPVCPNAFSDKKLPPEEAKV